RSRARHRELDKKVKMGVSPRGRDLEAAGFGRRVRSAWQLEAAATTRGFDSRGNDGCKRCQQSRISRVRPPRTITESRYEGVRRRDSGRQDSGSRRTLVSRMG